MRIRLPTGTEAPATRSAHLFRQRRHLLERRGQGAEGHGRPAIEAHPGSSSCLRQLVPDGLHSLVPHGRLPGIMGKESTQEESGWHASPWFS